MSDTKTTYDMVISTVFHSCVDLLERLAVWMGISYEEINILIFVLFHPLLTASLLGISILQWLKLREQHL